MSKPTLHPLTDDGPRARMALAAIQSGSIRPSEAAKFLAQARYDDHREAQVKGDKQ
jgi:hypothetical protein